MLTWYIFIQTDLQNLKKEEEKNRKSCRVAFCFTLLLPTDCHLLNSLNFTLPADLWGANAFWWTEYTPLRVLEYQGFLRTSSIRHTRVCVAECWVWATLTPGQMAERHRYSVHRCNKISRGTAVLKWVTRCARCVSGRRLWWWWM